MRDQAVAQRVAIFLLVVVQKLDLHFGHVHAGRALAFAAFAAHAQVHALVHGVAGECVVAELSRQRQPQGVGAATGQVLLVPRDPVTRAHGAAVKFAAMAVVVAHFHRHRKAPGVVAAAAGRGADFGDRVELDVPGRPVQRGRDGDAPVGLRGVRRWKPEQGRVVHARRVDDLARIEQAGRIHVLLDVRQRLRDVRAELPLNPFTPAQAVAVFAAVGAFEAAHQRRGFFCDCAHLAGAVASHVQNGAHMQRPDRGVRIPGATRAVARKDLGERVGVVGQVLQRHRAVLDKADRFAIALEAHHDVQARFAHLPQRFLLRVLRHVHHTVGQSQIAHQRGQLLQLGHHRSLAVAAKLHQQNGVRPADQGGLHHRLKSRVRQTQRHHAAVHQFHRRGPELDDVLRRQHGVAKAREVHDAQHLGTGQGAQLQRQVFGVSQGAF